VGRRPLTVKATARAVTDSVENSAEYGPTGIVVFLRSSSTARNHPHREQRFSENLDLPTGHRCLDDLEPRSFVQN